MITARLQITGEISGREKLSGSMNGTIKNVYPELENIRILPTKEEQTFNHPDSYGYNEIIVDPVTSSIDENIKPEYIKEGINILGVEGEFKPLDTSDATATEEDILLGKTAYVNGEKLTGTYEVKGEEIIITPSKEGQVQEGLFSKVTVTGDENLIPENIKQGVSIFNIEGQFEGQSSETYNSLIENPTGNYTTFTVQYWLKQIDNLDTTGVTNMGTAFKSFNNLRKLPASLNTSSVTAMNQTFYGCSVLQEIPEMDISNVTNMSSTFHGCSNITKLPNNFDTTKAETMDGTFYNCEKLTEAILENTSNVTTFRNCFYNCTSITKISIGDTSKATRLDVMFYGCTNLTELSTIDSTSNTQLQQMFQGCSSIKTVSIVNTSKVTSTTSMFNGATSLQQCPDLDTSNVTSMNIMFSGCTSITDIPQLNAIKSKNVQNMFANCTSLVNFGGLLNLGQGYTQKTANYSNYTLDLSTVTSLTHDSLMNVINGLYDLNLAYKVATGGTLYSQKLILGATNKAKLTEEEIAIATDKRLVCFVIIILPFTKYI